LAPQSQEIELASGGKPRQTGLAFHRQPLFSLFCILVVFVCLCVGTLATRLVAPNEGWFADPAYHLATKGVFGTTLLETAGTWLERLDRHTYWILPLYPVTLAPLFRIVGFGLEIMRAESIFWGVLAVAAFYFLMQSQAECGVALLATLLVSTDFHFIVGASVGRMDMMCAALGFSALAAYVILRERSFRTAVVLSHTLAAAASFTHPCGVLAAAGLVLLAFRFDRGRWKWRQLALASLPYVLGIAAYSTYALQDLPAFQRQLFGNVSGLAGEATGSTRFDGLAHPLSALRRELLERYVGAFIGDSWTSPYRLELVVLFLYWGGAIVALFDRRVRREKATRLILPLCILYFVSMWLLEGLKQRVYMVYTLPLFAGLGALWIWNWTEGRRYVRASVIIVIVSVQFLAIGIGVRENQYRNDYLPAAMYMKQHGGPGALIMGPGQLAFEFGFDGALVDDVRLGYFSGKIPEFYVRDAWYDDWLEQSKTRDPAVYKHVSTELAERYHEVFRNAGYKIYQLR
jgi:4-amino-4-deoxy-L-arabinose transferase-like glycosyltransferase